MTKALVAVLVLALIACDGKVTTSESERKVHLDKQHCSIPPDYSFNPVTRGIQYQPYRVNVEGTTITWNGADVTSEKLTEYARQVSNAPTDAGGVTFRVVGVSCNKRLQVRKALSRSGLCQANRCWEDDELQEEPVSYPHDEKR